MKTEVHLVGGEIVTFGDDAAVKLGVIGVEITESSGDEGLKVLFPWSRIEKVVQSGPGVGSVYTFRDRGLLSLFLGLLNVQVRH